MRTPRSIGILAVVAVGLACRADPNTIPAAAAQRLTLEPVPTSAVCVTSGAAAPAASGRGLRVDAGGVRAVVAGDHSSAAEVAFVYEGPSAFDAPLANGEMRRQIGLKLRAQDTCNVVYVMWHIEPTPSVAVSVKHNAGASTHLECGAAGYDNLKPEASAPPAPVERGVPHVLRADLEGSELRVTADGNVVWRGHLPAAAFMFDGPAGFRTDNGTFDLELRVPGGRAASGHCR